MVVVGEHRDVEPALGGAPAARAHPYVVPGILEEDIEVESAPGLTARAVREDIEAVAAAVEERVVEFVDVVHDPVVRVAFEMDAGTVLVRNVEFVGQGEETVTASGDFDDPRQVL